MAGGLVHFRGWPHTMRQDLLITLAGPIANLALGLAALALLKLAAGAAPETIVLDGKLVTEPFTQPSMIAQLLRATVYVNIGLGVVNLLPGIPLDGGRIVYLLVEQRWHSRTALLTVSSLGLFFATVNTFLLIGTIIAGFPIWAPPTFGANWEAFKAARSGPRQLGRGGVLSDSPLLERLAQKPRAFQPVAPRQIRGLGDADADAGGDLRFFVARIEFDSWWRRIIS